MAFDWASMNNAGYVPTGTSSDAEKMDRDMLRAQLEQQTLQQRQGFDREMAENNFMKQLELLKQTNEYNSANLREREAMEARLIAMQKGYIKPKFGQSGGGAENYQEVGGGGNDYIVDEIFGLAGMIGGGAAGVMNRGAMSKGLTAVGQGLSTGAYQKGASNYLSELASKNYKSNSLNTGKKNANIISNLLAKTSKEINPRSKGLGKLLGGTGKVAGKGLGVLGAKGAGKIGGALIGGVPGLLVGTALGEIVGNMMNSDDERERAKAQYMMNYMD